MEQYEMYFTNEYTEDIATELVSKMSIKFDKNKLIEAIEENDITSVNNIFFAQNGENKLIIDCNNRDWIYSLVAICNSSCCTDIKKIMHDWDNKIREEYDQELIEEIRNVFGETDTLLDSIEEYYKVHFL